MRTLYTAAICLLTILLLTTACGDSAAVKDNEDKPNANAPYILKETVATGDTGMARFSGIKKRNELDILCQHWEMPGNEGATSDELLRDKNGDRFTPGLDLFTDSTFAMNPRGDIIMGTWRVNKVGQELELKLIAAAGEVYTWKIYEYNSHSLRLTAVNEAGEQLYLNLAADGLVHRNIQNDPFHPANNQWRIQPKKPESDSVIAKKAKQCVKFYTLFYRDNILRQKKTINYAGLPDIFDWYRRGLGMPDWEDIRPSWLGCFYDSADARKGYGVLRKVIVDYEFNWPKGAPDWRMETESVLEQMYHKM